MRTEVSVTVSVSSWINVYKWRSCASLYMCLFIYAGCHLNTTCRSRYKGQWNFYQPGMKSTTTDFKDLVISIEIYMEHHSYRKQFDIPIINIFYYAQRTSFFTKTLIRNFIFGRLQAELQPLHKALLHICVNYVMLL